MSRAKKIKEKNFEGIDLLRLVMVVARMSVVLDSGGTIGADNNLAVITPTNIPKYAKTHIIWLDTPEPALKILKRRAISWWKLGRYFQTWGFLNSE